MFIEDTESFKSKQEERSKRVQSTDALDRNVWSRFLFLFSWEEGEGDWSPQR